MELAANSGESSPSQTEFPFRNGDDGHGGANEVQRDLSADPNTLPALPGESEISDTHAAAAPPVWLQRLWLIIYVVFCIELGMLLIILPWKPVWTTNSLLAHYPTLRAIFHNYFVRGLVTGVGVVDLWLGIAEAVHYHERKPGVSRR